VVDAIVSLQLNLTGALGSSKLSFEIAQISVVRLVAIIAICKSATLSVVETAWHLRDVLYPAGVYQIGVV
jgi:hypothetical protein